MFENMKIAARLYLLLGFLSILLIAIGVLGLRGIRAVNVSLESVYNDELIPATMLAELNRLRHENLREVLLARLHDPKLPESKAHEADHPMTRHTDAITTNAEKVNKLWQQYLAATLTPEEKKLSERFAAERERYKNEGQGPTVALLKEHRFDEASAHITSKLVPLFSESDQTLEALMQLQMDVAKAEKDSADAGYARTRNLALTGITLGILLAFGIGWWIIRSVTKRLGESVSAVSSSTTQIAATMSQHERTVAQQASAVNETTATIEELGASSRQSAEQAEAAAASAKQAQTMTEEGVKLANRAYSGMTGMKEKVGAVAEQILRLSEQAGQIGSIATVVSELASETNMLALNAAVEAARAGEHGKGFAVVAAEVRKLADQSKKSAERANLLVADIQKATNSAVMVTEAGTKTVEEVADIAQQAGVAFGSITAIATSVYQNAQQVMLNGKQQAAALTQVTEAMKSLGAGTKEMAAGTAQTRIGMEKLNEVAQVVKAMV